MVTQREVKEIFQKLNLSGQNSLLSELLLEQELQGKVLSEANEELATKRKKKPCLHCNSTDTNKRGKQKGVQMYRCTSCSKWYSETTGTALYDIKLKSKWQAYLNCMEKGMPIKKIAKELKISIQTSFDWRHKILSSLSQFTPDTLSDEIECDELELALNEKGSKNLQRKPRKRSSDFKRNQGKGVNTTVQVVTVVSRNGDKILKAVESKRLTKKEIAKVLDGKLDDKAILITDKHLSYRAYAKENPTIKHKQLLAKDRVDRKDKTIHLQKVNNIHSQLRGFLRPFNGVSSKYLQNYLNWYSYVGHLQNSKTTLKQWFLAMLVSDQAYSLFEMFKNDAVLIRT